eukprot:m.63351 g.63351  ORF g.63351 m.63351 type:complete len:734 (-) comp11433_c0_seq1:258-2459(-)
MSSLLGRSESYNVNNVNDKHDSVIRVPTIRRTHPVGSQPIKEVTTISRKGTRHYTVKRKAGQLPAFGLEGIGEEPTTVREKEERERERQIVNKTTQRSAMPYRDRKGRHVGEQDRPPFGTWWWMKYHVAWFFRNIGNGIETFWLNRWVSGHANAVAGKAGTSVGSLFELMVLLLLLNFMFMLFWTLVVVLPAGLAGPISQTDVNSTDITSLTLDAKSFGAVLTGTGPLTNSIVFYGFYERSFILDNFHVPTAYFSVILVTFCLTLFFFVWQILRLNRNNAHRRTLDVESRFGSQILSSWDFTITSQSGVLLQRRWCANLCRELIDEYRRKLFGFSRDDVLILGCIKAPSSSIISNIISVVVGVLYIVGVSFAAYYFQQFQRDDFEPGGVFSSNHMQALFVPGIVTLVIYFIPLVYIPFNTFNVFFDSLTRRVWTFIVVLCATGGFLGTYLATFANTINLADHPCWETHLGQEIYRLVLMNFILRTGFFVLQLMFSGLLHMWKKTNPFPTNVMNLFVGAIYTQSLLWIGFALVPFLPAISLIFSFITYQLLFAVVMYASTFTKQSIRIGRLVYIKGTMFVFLLTTVASCLLLFTREPGTCGPFQGTHRIFEVVETRVAETEGSLVGEGWNAFFLRGASVPVVIALLLTILYLKFQISAEQYLNDDLNYVLNRELFDFRKLLIAKKMLTKGKFPKREGLEKRENKRWRRQVRKEAKIRAAKGRKEAKLKKQQKAK